MLQDGSLGIALIEGHRISTPPKQAQNPRISDGVETDASGRVVAYWVAMDEKTWKPVPADQLFLWYEADPSRPNSCRGISAMRRALNDVRDAKDIKGYEKMASRIHSALAGVIESEEGGIEPVQFGYSGQAPPPPETPETPAQAEARKITVTEILSGTIPALKKGQVYKPVETNRPTANTREFLEMLSGHFVMAVGLPPSFIADLRLTGPAVRAVNGKAERRFAERQAIAKRSVRWTWLRVIGDAIAHGHLRSVPNWWSLTFQTTPKLSIDIGGDEAADLAAVESGLMSETDFNSKRGRDSPAVERVRLAERVRAIENAQKEASRLGVPLEMLLPGYLTAKSPTKPAEDPKDDDEEEERRRAGQDDDEKRRQNGTPVRK
jgi:capsid protein